MISPPFPVDQDTITKKIKVLKAQQPIGELFLAIVDLNSFNR